MPSGPTPAARWSAGDSPRTGPPPAGGPVRWPGIGAKEMSMIEPTRGSADLGSRLATRAQNDAGYRRRLLADPSATVEQELEASSAPAGKVLVHERGAQRHYLVLPLAAGAGGAGEARGRGRTDGHLAATSD